MSRTVAHLGLIYRGPAVEDGSMDVADLAPALLAAAGAARSAQEILLPDGPRVAVRVVALDAGSFDIALELVSVADQLRSFFASETGDAIRNVSAVLGALFGFLRWLQGRTPVEIVDDPTVTVIVVRLADTSIEVPRDVYRLYDDAKTRRHIEAITEPLEQEGYEELEVTPEDQEAIVITKATRPYFKAPVPTSQIVNDTTYTDWFTLHTIRTQSRNWMLRNSQGTVINAYIEDETFWNDYQAEQIPLTPGYQLRCRVRLFQATDLHGALTTTNTVLQVVATKPPDAPPEHPELNFNSSEEE